MTMGLIQGIPLSTATRSAWRGASDDIKIIRMRDDDQGYEDILDALQVTTILNYGSRRSMFNEGELGMPVINPAEVVRITSDRAKFEAAMGELAPTDRPDGMLDGEFYRKVWLKGPGRGGHNKLQLELEGQILEVPDGWTVQRHVEGEEWRINTANNLVVQSHRQVGDPDDPFARDYMWVGVTHTPLHIRELAKAGVKALTEAAGTSSPTVLAWDIIANEDEAWILEANTAPGMNNATASRTLGVLLVESSLR